MPESRQAVDGTGAGRGRRALHALRARTLAIVSFVLVVVGGLTLAAACGAGHGTGGDSAPGASRVPHPPGSAGHGAPHAHSPSPSPSPLWDRHPDSVAAVGDSITRGFDACSLLSDCSRVSWATGTNKSANSLARRLTGGSPASHSWNYAASGSVMADLPRQMARAARRKPGLVTVLAGANDACRPTAARMTPVAGFRDSFREALRTLRRKRPKSEVYVSSVPDLRRLWSQGRSDPLGERIWKLGICQSMLLHPESMTSSAKDRRHEVYERVVAYNSVLKQECAKVRRCRYDGGAVFGYRFTGAELSHWDFFHPSRRGQRKLAELAYEHITAAR